MGLPHIGVRERSSGGVTKKPKSDPGRSGLIQKWGHKPAACSYYGAPDCFIWHPGVATYLLGNFGKLLYPVLISPSVN